MISHRRMWGLVAIFLLALSGDAAAGPPAAGPRCEEERAKEAFSSAMERYSRKRWKEAAPDLGEAAAACPVLDWSYKPNPFLEFPYLPFYFLGKCNYNLEKLPDALRNFYLSSCTGEPARNKESTKDLSSLTESCRLRARSKQRPSAHPYFAEGYAASQQKEWEEAADRMWDALQVWEEDGKTTSSSGRWTAPYLPRFRLADALFQLGCYQEACDQLDRSRLEQIRPQGSEQELKRMAELKLQCERKRREGSQGKEICRQWQCFLRQGGP